METVNITGITSKEISRTLLHEGFTKKVECKNYWDSHGTRVECTPTQYKFDQEKKFEIWEVVTETHYPSIDRTQIYADWRLVEKKKKKKLKIGRVEGYDHINTKHKIDCCVRFA